MACVLFKSRGGFSPSAVTFLRQNQTGSLSRTVHGIKTSFNDAREIFIVHRARFASGCTRYKCPTIYSGYRLCPGPRLQVLNIKMRWGGREEFIGKIISGCDRLTFSFTFAYRIISGAMRSSVISGKSALINIVTFFIRTSLLPCVRPSTKARGKKNRKKNED